MALNSSLYKSEKSDWETPKEFFKVLNDKFKFDLDPCCEPRTAKAQNYFTRQDDGLSKPWRRRVYVNPPYGADIKPWLDKALHESRTNADVVVCLVPVRSDTKWWHEIVMKAAEIRFLNRRLTFEGANNKAPFAAAVVIFRKEHAGGAPLCGVQDTPLR